MTAPGNAVFLSYASPDAEQPSTSAMRYAPQTLRSGLTRASFAGVTPGIR